VLPLIAPNASVADHAGISAPNFLALTPNDALGCVNPKFRVNDELDEGIAPEHLESCVAEAAECCPVQVIYLS